VAPPDESCVLIEGPWAHRHVSANGIRFHVAEAGEGPLVLLLHGYPEFWWSWRHQLPVLAEAGFRAVAVDLRGYGASDKPPRGYDGYTLAGDVGGLIRALGGRDAALVGHGWGGSLAWTAAVRHRRMVRGLAVLAAPHPLRMRRALLGSRRQARASLGMLAYQLPRYEHAISRDGGRAVAHTFEQWAGPAWRATPEYAEHVARCQEAMRIPQAAFCALEYYRWALRSLSRPNGWAFARLLQAPVTVPTLQLHGALDRCTLPTTALGSGQYVTGRYEWRTVPQVGHFPQLEAPELVGEELVRWAKEV
jgi:pimeloyl-ACP methyl ester carboxylesterase